MSKNNSLNEKDCNSRKYHYVTINTKKLIIICIIFFIVLNSFLSIILKSNVLFTVFPNAGIFYSYKTTYNEIDHELSNFHINLEEQFKNTNLQKGNQISISLPKSYIELTKYNNLFKVFLNFNDNLNFTFYIDDIEFIFKINNGRYYSLLLNDYNMSAYNKVDTLNFSNDYNKTLVDTFKNNDSSNYTQKLSKNSRYDQLLSIILNNNSVNITDDHTELISSFTDEEFKELIWILTDNFDSKDFKIFSRLFVTMFLGNADNVYITSTLNNSDRLGNVIRNFSITTDGKNKSYLKISSLDKNSLLEKIEIEYNFLGVEDKILLQTDFNTLNNYLVLGINNNILTLDFKADSSSILINSNDYNFIRISDDLSNIVKPTNKIIINNNKTQLKNELFKLNNSNLFSFFKYISV